MLHNIRCRIHLNAKILRNFGFILCCLTVLCNLFSCAKALPMREMNVFAMDTFMSIKAYTDDETLLESAENEISRLESLFSVTDPDSDISRINRDFRAAVDSDTVNLLKLAKEYSKLTDKAVDISTYPIVSLWGFTNGNYRVPNETEIKNVLELVDIDSVQVDENIVQIDEGMQLDLGSVAKGYTSEMICEILRENGVSSAVVNLGGNVQTIGTKPDGSSWKIGVKNPFKTDENLLIVEANDRAVVTSGNYERYFEQNGIKYCHIFDTSTGYPVDNDLASVTVIGDNGTECDALSTALFVMGKEKAIEFWKKHRSVELILITKSQEILVTEGISSHCTNPSEFKLEVIAYD